MTEVISFQTVQGAGEVAQELDVKEGTHVLELVRLRRRRPRHRGARRGSAARIGDCHPFVQQTPPSDLIPTGQALVIVALVLRLEEIRPSFW